MHRPRGLETSLNCMLTTSCDDHLTAICKPWEKQADCSKLIVYTVRNVTLASVDQTQGQGYRKRSYNIPSKTSFSRYPYNKRAKQKLRSLCFIAAGNCHNRHDYHSCRPECHGRVGSERPGLPSICLAVVAEVSLRHVDHALCPLGSEVDRSG